MEALSILERVERLEKLNGITGPAICPDPTGEGSAWQGEAARSVPIGWIGCGTTAKNPGTYRAYRGQWIAPDPSIPWGEEYEAILPEEATTGDWRLEDTGLLAGEWLQHEIGMEGPHAENWWGHGLPWRRRKSPAEPAPGSDAEHPPEGYRLEPVGGERRRGYLWWHPERRELISCTLCVGLKVEKDIIANPIPANEGDSQKEVAELRATVERLTAENAAMDAQRNDAIKSRNQYRKELEELEEKMDAIKELAG